MIKIKIHIDYRKYISIGIFTIQVLLHIRVPSATWQDSRSIRTYQFRFHLLAAWMSDSGRHMSSSGDMSLLICDSTQYLLICCLDALIASYVTPPVPSLTRSVACLIILTLMSKRDKGKKRDNML